MNAISNRHTAAPTRAVFFPKSRLSLKQQFSCLQKLPFSCCKVCIDQVKQRVSEYTKSRFQKLNITNIIRC
ncbi:unnamed protein product [Acanthoscelides obtectus]|uniref:Uncharacterized protein n=1 Tax=Acanthoscelides obtectus TaxID=200917 RepID=A0A9P0PT31_ACAOB|nr:unnamed protein product [Acanthoscelides obtectus]CAK1630611.1 hypothetical protein AOBTE_LOCUS6448 [Acanthoscelides obtectus]